MRPANKIEKLIGKLHDRTSAELDERTLKDVFSAMEKSTKTQPALKQPNIWRIIMKNRMTKLATAAAVILIVVLVFTFLEKSVPTAYAIEQTIQANHSVRFIHIKDFSADEDEPKEFWVEFHNNGQVKGVRMDFPDWAAGGDGSKVVVWKQNKAQVWFKKKNSFITVADRRVADRMLDMIGGIDPKLAVKHLREREQRGELIIEIKQPSNKSEPITVTVTYLPSSPTPNRRCVLLVDQATKLVTAMESYELEDGEYQYLGYMEYHDYNQPIDAEMFTLEDEVPADAMRIDQTTQEVGLVQGDLGDEEIAEEVARRFFKALIAEDYAQAGKLMEGLPADKLREGFGPIKFLRIISVGPAAPHPIPETKGLVVPCEVEIEKDGEKDVWRLDRLGVRPVYNHPDRWTIFGGI